MVKKMNGEWRNVSEASGISFTCGYCGKNTAPSKRYFNSVSNAQSIIFGSIYICPNCNKPTFFNENTKEQVPGPMIGQEIQYLPSDIEQLYDEARKCLTVNAFTSTVLACRKLLMNISVSKGAEGGKAFAFYVTFLEQNHYIPPNSKEWVDHIRKKGNEATHEIPSVSREDAIELIDFTEMLLRIIYELPGRMTRKRE